MRTLVFLSLIAGAFSAGCDTIDCDQTKAPVCASDGNTYANICYLKVTACKLAENGVQLTYVSDGECTVKPDLSQIDVNTLTTTKCQMNCDGTDKYPVCGTDGVTYANKCFFYEAQCVYDSQGVRFDLAYVGECRKDTTSGSACSITSCDSTPAKYCGSDGNVYGSGCEFQKALCGDPSLTKVACSSTLSSLITDRCSEDALLNCDSTLAKICGSDGNVYMSQCELLKVKCSVDRTLTQVRCLSDVPINVLGTLG